MGFLDHMITPCLSFGETTTAFQCGSMVLYFRQQWTRVPTSPHSHQYLLLSFWLQSSYWKWSDSPLWFGFSFLWNTNDIEHFVMCLSSICIIYLTKSPFGPFALLKNKVFVFIIELQKFFIYYGYKSLIRYVICKYFLLFYGLCFYVLDSVLCSISQAILTQGE